MSCSRNIKRIVCGKFDDYINIDNNIIKKKNKIVRIGSINPNKLKTIHYTPIATNGKNVLYENVLYETRDFLSKVDRKKKEPYIVLTSKEKMLILEDLVDFDFDIEIFELKYPIFNKIKYTSNINKNYIELKKLLKNIAKLKITGNSLNHYLSTKHLFKIERALRFKNNLDYFFAFAYRGGYQEVFRLKEERSDRVVVAFDFNSMFIDCMKGDFVEPKSLEYENYRGKNILINNLNCGLYRVILRKPKETFFTKFHPFKYNYLCKSFYFNIEKNHEIEILLFTNEIIYYSKFFDVTEILEGFFSKKTINHPLIKEAGIIYKERVSLQKRNIDIMSSLCKRKLITMHSATNQKKYKTMFFSSKDNLINYLSSNYMISFPEEISFEEKITLLQDYKWFIFNKSKKGYKLKIINYSSNESIFSFSSQILANSRLKMIETIEKFQSYDSVELCYANVDSLHISIKRSELQGFLSKFDYIISDRLGDLKIQSISDRGYWFDVGRYWLIGDGIVTLFKNVMFNYNCNPNKFLSKRKLKIVCNGKLFSYVKNIYMNIENSFSYNKKLTADESIDNYDFVRYHFHEVENLNVAGDSYINEVLNSKQIKTDLFYKIATV